MPYPQVADRVKEAPAVVLRAVFAGIGRLLLAADKIRARVMEQPGQEQQAAQAPPPRPRPAQPPAGETGNVRVISEEPEGVAHVAEPAPEPPAAAPSPTPPAAKPPAKPAAAGPAPAGPRKPAVKPARAGTRPARAPRTKPAAGAPGGAAPRPPAGPAAPAEPAAAAPSEPAATPREPAAAKGPGASPIPGYDDLSVASLRGRLRVFDAATVRTLLEYERSHAARDSVIAMFERRLAKLEGAAG